MFRSFVARFQAVKYTFQILSRYQSTASGKATIKPVTPGKRTPSIKFGKRHNMVKDAKASTAPAKAADGKKSKGPVIEDWELPHKYRRKLPEKEEMEYINRGGPP